MTTASLKSFASGARTTLVREVNARIAMVLAPASAERVEFPRVIHALETAIEDSGGGAEGRAAVADRVAYTWFNRIVALRFMDANGYTGIGVVSPPNGSDRGQPEILAEAKRGIFDDQIVQSRTRDAVSDLLNGSRRSDNAQGEAYSLLLVDYCRHWHRTMPFMFSHEGDFTEILMPGNLLADDSLLDLAVKELTSEACRDVEVIGWLYQFYISELKDAVYAGFNKVKAGPAEIPPATQIFTPHWIVRYLVENSVGRLWMLNRPSSPLVEAMPFYLAPTDVNGDFLKISSPEELKVIDPACGSGHLLTYAFDLLYAIYEEEGYAPSEIPGLILGKNLHGTEIDPRAGALAAFALTMKARSRQRRFFAKPTEPHVVIIQPVEVDVAIIDGDDVKAVAGQFDDADVLGALIRPKESHAQASMQGSVTTESAQTLDAHAREAAMRQIAEQVQILTDSYDVVVANPPYLGTRHMGERLRGLASGLYPDTKGDLCAMFLERSLDFLRPGGVAALVTSESWFFNTSFRKTREHLARRSRLRSAVCIDSLAFGVRLNTVAAVLELGGASGDAVFTRVDAEVIRSGGPGCLPVAGAPVHTLPVERFDRVPGGVYAFDMPQAMLALYEVGGVLGDSIETKQGMATTDNSRFVRFWWEVSESGIGRTHQRGAADNPAWVPYNKGGTPIRWWGNQEHVVRWLDDGRELRGIGAKSISQGKFFEGSVSWSNIGKAGARFRLYPPGFVFDVAGMSAFAPDEKTRLNLLGYLNAPIVGAALDVLAPTLNYQVGDVARLPVPDLASASDDSRVREMIDISRERWASQETARGFVANPLLSYAPLSLEHAVSQHLHELAVRQDRLNELEAESSRYWLDTIRTATGVNPEMPLPGPLDDAGVPTAGDLIEDLVSYSVGCMFGRYSIDSPGPILGNAGDTLADYARRIPEARFLPDADNVIPIVDGDWFEDDIVVRFRQFLATAFGDAHLESNLRFVVDSLGVKDLRAYFLRSLYKQHWRRYRKRPIYWLFSSPNGSFNALIYLHRYNPSTISTVLNEYLREYRAKLEAHLGHLERSGAGREAARTRSILVELEAYERQTLYPLAAKQVEMDLDDGVRKNYAGLGAALAHIPGLVKED